MTVLMEDVEELDEKGLHKLGKKITLMFLEKRGYEILDSKPDYPGLDIVALDRKEDEEDAIVFVECLVNRGAGSGYPKENISALLRAEKEMSSMLWLASQDDLPEATVRFDIVSLSLIRDNRALVRHHINALSQSTEALE